MNAIMNDRSRGEQPQSEDEDQSAHQPVLTRDRHSKADVSDDQPRSQHNEEADLAPHQVAHVRKPTDCRYDLACPRYGPAPGSRLASRVSLGNVDLGETEVGGREGRPGDVVGVDQVTAIADCHPHESIGPDIDVELDLHTGSPDL
jgi:hypothetical protein